MSTADYPDALTRRIEQLAAASVEEPEGEGAAVAALVGALRAEIGAVRAELGALRSETGAVRSDLDGLGGRLTGSVAASRSETGTLVRRVAELATRIDGVGGRVDDVRNGLPSLSRELREGLSDVPVRTSARLDELTGALTEAVAQRVAAVAADVHRSLNAASEREAKAGAAAAVSLEEARLALEARLAALEDALDAMSERIEALARDGASTTTAKLVTLQAGVTALAQRIEAEGRDNAELLVGRLRDVTETRMSELEDTLFDRLSDTLRIRNDELRRDLLASVESAREQASEDRAALVELAGSVRAALDGLGTVLDHSLSGLGRSVTAALTEGRESSRDELDALAEQVVAAVSTLQLDLATREAAATTGLARVQESLEGRLELVRSQLATAVTVLRSDMATEVGTLTPRVDELVAGGAVTSESLRTLRGDVLATVEELRDRVVATTTDSTEVLRSAMTETRAEVADIVRALREDLLDRIEEKYGVVADRLVEVNRGLTGSTGSTRAALVELGTLTARVDELRSGVSGRVAELETTLTGQLGALGTEVGATTTTTREAAERVAALLALAERHRDEVERLLERVRADVAEAGAELRTELLGTTGQALSAVADKLTVLDVTVDERQADVVQRLRGVDEAVTRSAEGAERTVAGLADFAASTDALAQTVAGFRSEWPTRTFEVVQGAKAVAEGVVRDVRDEVTAQLERVQVELARAVDGVEDASTGLSSGTDRLSRAGKVLVTYLEERDRLLEAERDRVLHEVLDAFAAGLSARDRTALAARVGDAVTRRRDARDADRFRAAVGTPVAPTADLPEQVRELEPAPAAEAEAEAAGRRQAVAQRTAATREGPVPPTGPAPAAPSAADTADKAPTATTRAARTTAPTKPAPTKAAPTKAAPTKAAPTKPAPAKAAPTKPAPAKPAPTKPAPTKAAPIKPAPTKPAPGKPAPTKPAPTKAAPIKPAPTKPAPAKAAPGKTLTRSAPGPGGTDATRDAALTRAAARADRRARVDVMPEARSPKVALDAAAPRQKEDPGVPAPARAAVPVAGRTAVPTGPPAPVETSWGSRRVDASQEPEGGEEDTSVRRLFRRRKP